MQQEKKFRIKSRDYALTYPKCSADVKRMLFHYFVIFETLEYACVAEEKHKDGTDHRHVQLQFKTTKEMKTARTLDYCDDEGQQYHGNYQQTKDSQSWNDYIKKCLNFVEQGVFHYINKPRRQMQDPKEKNKQLFNKIMTNELTDLLAEGSISIYNYTQLKKAKQDINLELKKLPQNYKRQSYWVYGAPGIGKSYIVRQLFKDLYVKPSNKWWDGYKGEDAVYIEDFDTEMLGHNLKIWSDHYSFNAEIKGGTIQPSYTKFIITSNKLPEDIFKDKDMEKAVSRRFRFCTVEGEYPDYKLIDYYTSAEIII